MFNENITKVSFKKYKRLLMIFNLLYLIEVKIILLFNMLKYFFFYYQKYSKLEQFIDSTKYCV